MTSFIEIEPMLTDTYGTPIRLGVVRYAVPDELIGGKLAAQQVFIPYRQDLTGGSFRADISFFVTVRDGDVPQPIPPTPIGESALSFVEVVEKDRKAALVEKKEPEKVSRFEDVIRAALYGKETQ